METTPSKSKSLITNYSHQLRSALSELGCPASESQIEAVAIFLLRTMGSELRDYHKPEHSIDVSAGQPPVARIASLFHDCVYVQVDPTWKTSLRDMLQPLLPSDGFVLNVKEGLLDPNVPVWFKVVATVFGCEGETAFQPAAGLNELLSALIMVTKMQSLLKPVDLLKAVACIEATIPFRKVDAQGQSPSQRLKKRLPIAAKHLSLTLTEKDLSHVTHECRSIVENDLAGFGAERLNTFLSGTWNVMNENNASLRNSFFLISDYRKAVHGSIGFFQSLNPDHLFWSDAFYETSGEAAKNARLVEKARYNLLHGVGYLKAVGLSLSIIEAVALETGGDAPFEFFVGSLKKSREHNPLEIDEFLTLEDNPTFASEAEKEIYSTLKNGRELRAKFDRKNSPLGAFLYAHLQKTGQLDAVFQTATLFHQGQSSGRDLFGHLPQNARTEIFSAISQLATARADKINALTHT